MKGRSPSGVAPAPSGDANAPAANQPAAAAPIVSRDAAIAASPRVKIDTPRLIGSIALKGARIDDLSLVQFRETVDPTSPAIELFSPSNTANPYYAEFGWVPSTGSTARLPDRVTAVALLASAIPLDLYGTTKGLTSDDRLMLFLVRWAPAIASGMCVEVP